MTLGLAMVVHDGVVLVADGRVTTTRDEHHIVGNDYDKIHLVHSRLAVVLGGALPASERALAELRTSAGESALQVMGVAARGIQIGLINLQAQKPVEYAASLNLRAALLIAGIDPIHGPYVGLVEIQRDHTLRVDGPHYQQLRYAIFSTHDRATELVMERLSMPQGVVGNGELMAQAVVGFTALGISAASDVTPAIGGTVRGVYLSAGGVVRSISVAPG